MIVTRQPRIKANWSPTGRSENTQDYYVVREAVADCEDYWAPKSDPDGVVRNRDTEDERQQYLADLATELSFVNELSPDSVLDFGAGLGWFLSGVKSPRKLAVEPSTYGSMRLARQGIPVYYDIADVPTCFASVVVSHHVFEHLKDPISAINHVRRVLNHGGYLVLGTPDFGSPCAVRFGQYYRMLHDKTHCSLFTLESMTRFLRDHGFDIIAVKFPFPDRYATAENFMRWNDTTTVSPPWPGNWMTFYARRT